MKEMITIRLLYQFLLVKQLGLSIEEYLISNNIKSVFIYGMGYVGRSLIKELEGSSIIIEGVIDIHADQLDSDQTLFFPEDDLPEADAIIITPTYLVKDLEEYYGKKDMRVISLEDILYDIQEVV